MAPKGNKNGVGHGRPPKEGYSEQEVIALGEELLAWMRACDANKDCDVVHLSEFYCEIKDIVPSYWDKCITKRACFSGYYEKALRWMGKRLLKNKNLPTSYGNRFLPIYYKEVHDIEFEQEKRKIDYMVEKKTNAVYDDATLNTFDGLMSQFRSSQSVSKIDTIKSKVETKSE